MEVLLSDPTVVWSAPTITALCVSGAATLIAGTAAVVSYLVYRTQADPDVAVYAESDEGRPSIVNLIIENKGNASAHNVRFSWEGKLPANAYGVSVGGEDKSEQMKEGPLVHGIPFLPPGGKRVITWGQYGGILKGLDGRTMEVRIEFASKRRLRRGYRQHETSCPLEILSFEATDASDRNWDKKIADNVDKLKSSIERESRNWMHKLDDMQSNGTPEQAGEPSDDSAQEPEGSEGQR